MTIRKASEVLGVKVRTIRKWIKNKSIKAEKIGKCWNIPEDEVYSEGVQERANKGREHSKRIKKRS